MSIFASLYKHTLGRVIPKSPDPDRNSLKSRKRKIDNDANVDNGAISRRRKRDSPDENKEVITKRRRVDAARFAPIVDGETYESTLIDAPSNSYGTTGKTTLDSDSVLMPPPPISPVKNKVVYNIMQEHGRRTSMDLDDASQLSFDTKATQHKPADEFVNEYDMERARRHAAATTLPANSGIWERGEKELFFHLSYRGFEPIFPQNWMTDFRTMPLSLFPSDEPDAPEPLIRVLKRKTEFRAIRELRSLLDLGKNVRDKVLTSPGFMTDSIIERSTKRYIDWAMSDANIRLAGSNAARRGSLPIHVVVKLKARQTTSDCLLEMKHKMHSLRKRHCEARNIHLSIERDAACYDTPDSGGQTQIVEASEDDFPVLYGIMICRSILAIFTLNSRTPSPKLSHWQPSLYGHYQPSPAPTESIHDKTTVPVASSAANLPLNGMLQESTQADAQLEDDAASNPRYISDFDFSDPAKDVWNALVIAIVAMQIRRDMLLVEEHTNIDDSLEDIRAGIEEQSVMDAEDDDPDA